MARMKPTKQLPTLSSWDEVDLALKSIGSLQRSVEAAESVMQEEIDAAKLKAKEATDPVLAKIAAISRQVQDYAELSASKPIRCDAGSRQACQTS